MLAYGPQIAATAIHGAQTKIAMGFLNVRRRGRPGCGFSEGTGSCEPTHANFGETNQSRLAAIQQLRGHGDWMDRFGSGTLHPQ
jgi:hypothetical protein